MFSKRNPNWLDWSGQDLFIEKVKNGASEKLWFSTFAAFYRSIDGGNYDWLVPKPHVVREVERWREKMGASPIGCHIRRTDNVKSIQCSPDELFVDEIKRLLDEDVNLKFFLATDDDVLKGRFLKMFGDHCVTRNAAQRQDKKGVFDAVIDLLLLSACKRKIYGSYWSSFSEVAAEIGKCQLECLRI